MSDHVPLRDYLEARLADLLSWVEAEIRAIRAVAAKSDETLTIRLDHMNEFRRQIESQETRYAQRTELTSLREKIDEHNRQYEEDIAGLRKELAELRTGNYVTNARLALIGTGFLVVVAATAAVIQVAL